MQICSKIIAKDLRLVASRLYQTGVTRPWTGHVSPSTSFTQSFLKMISYLASESTTGQLWHISLTIYRMRHMFSNNGVCTKTEVASNIIL